MGVGAGANAIKVVIADDHPLFRSALSHALGQCLANPQLLAVGSFEELGAVLESAPDADLLLLDLNMPGARGYSALVHARSVAPALPVIVVSAYEDASVARAALDHGAAGFIPKSASPEIMAQAVTTVLDGGTWVPEGATDASSEDTDGFTDKLALLTPQQQRVLVMLTEGMLNKQIAIDLEISEATVKAHITAILRKLGVHTRTQAVIAARSLEIDWSRYARNDPDAPDG